MAYIAVDVDGTLTHSNISYLFGRHLYKNNAISFFSAFWMVCCYFLQRIGLVSLQFLHAKIFSELFKGKSVRFFEEQAVLFFSSQKTLFRQNIVEDILLRQKNGDTIVLLSASPDFLVRIVAATFSLQKWYGTEYLVDRNGNFSALGRILTGEEKANLVKKECTERLIAMTDSMQDWPLVVLADTVILVAPSWALRRKIRATQGKSIIVVE